MPTRPATKKKNPRKVRAGASGKVKPAHALQLKITLTGTKPPVWRRVLVPDNLSFHDLHIIIQIAMGWTNSHLHEFVVDGRHLGTDDDGYDMSELGVKTQDDKKVELRSLIGTTGTSFVYEYDFGDGWRHDIRVEKMLPLDLKNNEPSCLDGAMRCPPEDCGGLPGFYYMLSILADKKHPERKEMLEWLGEPFDPEAFDIQRVNQYLKHMDPW